MLPYTAAPDSTSKFRLQFKISIASNSTRKHGYRLTSQPTDSVLTRKSSHSEKTSCQVAAAHTPRDSHLGSTHQLLMVDLLPAASPIKSKRRSNQLKPSSSKEFRFLSHLRVAQPVARNLLVVGTAEPVVLERILHGRAVRPHAHH